MKTGWENKNVQKIYCSVLRSVIEYGSVVYDSLLTLEQSNRIENLQKRVLKMIYGYDKTYDQLLNVANLERIDTRRGTKVDKFVKKTEKNPMFCDRWFTLNHNRTTRISEKYCVPKVKSRSGFRNPMVKFAQKLNKLYKT